MKYIVRVSGNAPVWADIEVEAESVEEAREKAGDTDPATTADWEFCEGGNGVDDWTVAEVMDENMNEIEEAEAEAA